MPSIAAHFLLASRVLRDCADLAPFRDADTAFRNAFLNGAIGPDMGYYPGGDPFITDLAHYVRSTDLARAILQAAQTPTEAGYALGWLTHVVADVDVHPLVNRGVATLLTGASEPAIPYEKDPVAHLRVELGLDAYVQRQYRNAFQVATHCVFATQAHVRFLQIAIDQTYGVALPAESLLRSHRCAIARVPLLLRINRILSRTMTAIDALVMVGAYLPLKAWTALRSPRGIAYGATHTVQPTDWLCSGLHRCVDGFAGRFRALLGGELETYPNHNLDTGAVDGEPPDYDMVGVTLRRLADMRAASDATPARKTGWARRALHPTDESSGRTRN